MTSQTEISRVIVDTPYVIRSNDQDLNKTKNLNVDKAYLLSNFSAVSQPYVYAFSYNGILVEHRYVCDGSKVTRSQWRAYKENQCSTILIMVRNSG